ncbi:MYG1 exonuclease isoform X2 [Petromyzon marinus]|uniref:MYG1 exonuclease isoform X2 n=1 Tax=Petromyzon marinus TaxID=7757 RepID=UPI003F6E4E66
MLLPLMPLLRFPLAVTPLLMSPGPGSPKRLRTMATIGTHDGTFHCDEVLACFLLRQLPRYKDAKVVRTRDPKALATCDVVVDVGGEYDPGRHRYDHHQRSFAETMHSLCAEKPWVTKLSSAGLVYMHFGEEVITSITGLGKEDANVTTLYNKMYEKFVEEVDAIDNGISQHDGEPRYAITTGLSARVGRLNPMWNDPDQSGDSLAPVRSASRSPRDTARQPHPERAPTESSPRPWCLTSASTVAYIHINHRLFRCRLQSRGIAPLLMMMVHMALVRSAVASAPGNIGPKGEKVMDLGVGDALAEVDAEYPSQTPLVDCVRFPTQIRCH